MTASGRRPADAGSDNRQIVWDTLRAAGGAWMDSALMSSRTGVHRKTAADYIAALAAGGYIERRQEDGDGAGGKARLMLRLVKDAGHHAPRLRKDGTAVTQGAGVTNMWRSMRMLGKFSVLDLSLHSSTPAVRVTIETAKAYCGMLLSTGYLRVVQKAEPVKGRIAIYRLIRNDGPKAPMIQRVKQVYDPNTGRVYQRGGQQ